MHRQVIRVGSVPRDAGAINMLAIYTRTHSKSVRT
jgi:hypothetical protein